MRFKKNIQPEEVYDKCFWCNKTIADLENTPVSAINFKSLPGLDLSDAEPGIYVYSLDTQNKDVMLGIPDPESEASTDGFVFLAMICSEECMQEFNKGMEEEAKHFPAG